MLDTGNMEGSRYLGIEGEGFAFHQLASPVEFVAISAKSSDLGPLLKAIQGHL